MAGGKVQERLVDFFEAPMRLQREETAVVRGPERAEVGAPIDFAEAHRHARRDVRGAGGDGGVADGILDVEVKEARREADEVGRRGGDGAGHVEDVARIPDRAGAVGGERGEDGEGFLGGGREAGVFVFDAEADARAGREVKEAGEVFDDAGLFRGFGGIRRAEKGEDAEEVGVEFAGDVEAAFKDVAVGGDCDGVVEVALEDGRRAADDAPAFGARCGRDLGDVGAGEVFEGAAVEAAEFDPGELELAEEGPDDGEVLGDFVGDEGDVVGKVHGQRGTARWSPNANEKMTGQVTSRRLF